MMSHRRTALLAFCDVWGAGLVAFAVYVWVAYLR